MNSTTKKEIHDIVGVKMLEVFERRSEEPSSGNPFTKALLPNVDPKMLAFERSFSTSFGQSVVEQMATLIAEDAGAAADRQHVASGEVTEDQLRVINEIKRELRRKSSGRVPNWEEEFSSVRAAANSGSRRTIEVTSDLYVRTSTEEMFFSIKSPKANMDQASQAKVDCLHLVAIDPSHKPHFALHHNPYGRNIEDYDWGITLRTFSLHSPVLLIGEPFWDKLGGSGTYSELLSIFDDVNTQHQAEIQDFFGS